MQFFSRDYQKDDKKSGSFLQLIYQPIRKGSKEGSSQKINSSNQSVFSAQFNKNSRSSNKYCTTTLNNDNSTNIIKRKDTISLTKQIKQKLSKNTKTSETKKKNGKFTKLFNTIKTKFFNAVADSPPICKPLLSLVAKVKVAQGKGIYEEDRK